LYPALDMGHARAWYERRKHWSLAGRIDGRVKLVVQKRGPGCLVVEFKLWFLDSPRHYHLYKIEGAQHSRCQTKRDALRSTLSGWHAEDKIRRTIGLVYRLPQHCSSRSRGYTLERGRFAYVDSNIRIPSLRCTCREWSKSMRHQLTSNMLP